MEMDRANFFSKYRSVCKTIHLSASQQAVEALNIVLTDIIQSSDTNTRQTLTLLHGHQRRDAIEMGVLSTSHSRPTSTGCRRYRWCSQSTWDQTDPSRSPRSGSSCCRSWCPCPGTRTRSWSGNSPGEQNRNNKV